MDGSWLIFMIGYATLVMGFLALVTGLFVYWYLNLFGGECDLGPFLRLARSLTKQPKTYNDF